MSPRTDATRSVAFTSSVIPGNLILSAMEWGNSSLDISFSAMLRGPIFMMETNFSVHLSIAVSSGDESIATAAN